MRIYVKGDIAVRGTIELIREKEEELRRSFSSAFMRRACSIREETAEFPEGELLCMEIGRGGITQALWDLAESCHKGLRVSLTDIPIRPETIEICNILDVDPYTLDSYGAVLIFAPGDMQVEGSEIGCTADDKKRLLRYGDVERYLRPII